MQVIAELDAAAEFRGGQGAPLFFLAGTRAGT